MDSQKIQMFKQAAIESGYSPDVVDSFVQKEALSVPTPQLDTIPQPEPYDPTGKTVYEIMAETGRQGELDQLTHGNTQPLTEESLQALTPSLPKNPYAVELPKQNSIIPDSAPVTQTFGQKSSAEQFSNGVNYGTDIAVPRRTPVAVPPNTQWKVVDSFGDAKTFGSNQTTQQKATNSGYGNSVLVEDITTGARLRLSHLDVDGVLVKPGQVIDGGSVIGYSGATGNVAGSGGGFHLDTEYYTPEGQLDDIFNSPYAPRYGAAPPVNQQELPINPVPQAPSPTVPDAASAVKNSDLTSPLPQQAEIVPPAAQQSPIMETQPTPNVGNSLQDTLSNLFSFQPNKLEVAQVEQPAMQAPQLSEMPQETVQEQPLPKKQDFTRVYEQIPETQRKDAEVTVPYIVEALKAEGIDDPAVVSYALATAQAESGFRPKEEVMADPSVSERNAYIAGLQNNYEGGKQYRGRGLIQLTHKGNYQKYGDRIGEDLVNNPDKLLDPKISAKVLAAYIKDSGVADAVKQGDYDTARVRVQGKGALNSQFIGKTREIAQQAKLWQQYLGE